jgi:fructan beta-fructosidase
MKEKTMNMCIKKNRLALFVILFISISNIAKAQYYPHDDNIDYKEDYRGQYHFSPKTGWMNDINGLFYFNNKYHMIYMWGYKTHGAAFTGYATSPDLLHWTDRGVAHIGDKKGDLTGAVSNATGYEIFSGSGVVVSGTTAQAITGSTNEAMIAIYTGTKVGTCLSWSNDDGATWNAYPGNPVANPTTGTVPRDPFVMWYEPTSQWILLIYENGTSFYGSSDLINWTFLSNHPFGYECPDFFELPLDGNENNKKWVLSDASGRYLVGSFDGTTFTADKEEKGFLQDVGPDFYAAQHFYRPNLPGGKVIQIAWNDNWNGGIGEKGWERNATFPVSLELITVNGQKRITRNPIREISSIYESTKTWESQLVEPGTNLLEGIHSKKFELSLEIDLTETTALTFGIRVANRYVIYDIHNKTLLSKKLLADDSNHVSIRLLVDWGQLEVFGNNGIFSYSQQFAFSPDHNNIELFTDGDIKLIKMEFHELARTW